MKKPMFVIAVGIAISYPGFVIANPGPDSPGLYIGADFAVTGYAEPALDTVSPTMVGVRGGYQFNEFIALESRISIGMTDDSILIMHVPASLKLDTVYGAYLRGSIPMGESFALSAVAGYTHGSATLKTGGTSISDSESGLSYGLGLDYKVNDRVTIGVEWMRAIKNSMFIFETAGIGIRYSFGK